MVKLGFLGCGFMGQMAHLYNYDRIESCQVVALAEVRPQLAQKVAHRYDIERIYPAHEALLADTDVDAVVMSQPFQRNYSLGKQVLAAGKHLFTEKPMVARYDEAEELVALAGQNNLVYAVGFMKRYDPGVALAKHWLDTFRETGELGRLRMVDSTCFLGDWLQNPGTPIHTGEPVPQDDIKNRYPEFLPAEQQSIYEHFLNIYSHNINLLHFLCEHPLECTAADQHDRAFLVSMRSGEVLVSLRGVPSKSHHWDEQTTFYFEKGRVEIQTPTPLNRQAVAEVKIWREINQTWTQQCLLPAVEWAFFRQARAFVEAVAGVNESVTAGKDCLTDVELMENIFKKWAGN